MLPLQQPKGPGPVTSVFRKMAAPQMAPRTGQPMAQPAGAPLPLMKGGTPATKTSHAPPFGVK